MSTTTPSCSLLDLPEEILLYVLCPFLDFWTIRSFAHVNSHLFSLSTLFLDQYDLLMTEKIHRGRRAFLFENKNCERAREGLSEEDRVRVDEELRLLLRRDNIVVVREGEQEEWRQEEEEREPNVADRRVVMSNREFAEEVGKAVRSGASVAQKFGFRTPAGLLAFDIWDHREYPRLFESVQRTFECARLQLLSGYDMSESRIYVKKIFANGRKVRSTRPVAEFIGYYFARLLHCRGCSNVHRRKLFRDSVRLLRDAGVPIPSSNIGSFLNDMEPRRISYLRLENSANVGVSHEYSEATVEWRTVVREFVRFLIDECECDPFDESLLDPDEDGKIDLEVIPLSVVLRDPDLKFVLPELFRPFEMARRDKDWSMGKNQSVCRHLKAIILRNVLSPSVLLSSGLLTLPMVRNFIARSPEILFHFVSAKQRKIFKYLVRTHASDLKAVIEQKTGATLLHAACRTRGKTGRLVRLFLRIGCDVNSQNRLGLTPLMLAIQIHQVEVIEILLECGADVDVVERQGRSSRQLFVEDDWLAWRLRSVFAKRRRFQTQT